MVLVCERNSGGFISFCVVFLFWGYGLVTFIKGRLLGHQLHGGCVMIDYGDLREVLIGWIMDVFHEKCGTKVNV